MKSRSRSKSLKHAQYIRVPFCAPMLLDSVIMHHTHVLMDRNSDPFTFDISFNPSRIAMSILVDWDLDRHPVFCSV